MNATDPSLANILQTQGNLEHYHVPKYQREYTWGKNEWEQLINDIEENDVGYFMGSIICIDDNEELSPGQSRIYDVVDGQQRLTTLSLILMGIYRCLLDISDEMNEVDDEEILEDYKLTLSSIRKQLVHKKNEVNRSETGYFKDKTKYCFLRVMPSTQKNNYKDYLHILGELDLINGNFNSKFCGLRRMYKAYDYFYQNMPESLEELNNLLHKINSLKFIHISVSSSSDAFTLFESLNNRGVPLSIMDIMKNKMLAKLEKEHKMNIDDAYEEWQELLAFIPEFKDQERFLRHYYNAFKVLKSKRIEKYTRATKSNLIKIYETYIKNDAKEIFEDLLEKAKTYNYFIEPETYEDSKQSMFLIELNNVGAAPSYLLLLFLYSLEDSQFINKENDLDEILDFLIKYYVRRNITDFPNTRNLDAINIELIETCFDHIENGEKIDSSFIIDSLLTGRGKPSELSNFKEALSENLYYYNAGMTRYVLVKLDEISHSREYKPDLWARNPKGLLVWTIEHIFPQGNNIPEPWIKMIAKGDKKEAKRIQEDWVHCLGNLTLSGYNSKLSYAGFEEKQNLHENKKFLGHQINIGYKNGLALNKMEFNYNDKKESLAKIKSWDLNAIQKRNEVMVNTLLKLFAFSTNEFEKIDT